MTVSVTVPDHLPLSALHTINLMRCASCGAVFSAIWANTRKTRTIGVDHILDEHRTDLLAGRLRAPLFVNCAIYDPFRLDEWATEGAA